MWLFCAAWLIGNIALIIGFNGAGGEVPAVLGFAIACVSWWIGYRLGGTQRRAGVIVGLLAMGIWTLDLLGALLFAFHHYVTDLFFWAFATALLALIFATALSETRHRMGEPESHD